MSEERKMKCDELTIYHSKNLGLPVYLKSEADKVIAEKDKEIAKLKDRYKDMDMAHTVHIAKMNDKIEEQESEIAELKATCVFTDNSAVIENMAAELEKLRPMETALELAEADNKGYQARIKTLEAKNGCKSFCFCERDLYNPERIYRPGHKQPNTDQLDLFK